MKFTRIADGAIYSSRALAAAREAYGPYCTVHALPGEHGQVTVTVTTRPECEANVRQILLEFWNYYLDAACQRRLDTESD